MRTLLALLALAVPLAAAPVPKGIKKPSADGLWQLVEYRSNGEAVPDGSAELACKYWRVEGERMTQGYRTPDEARKSTQMFTLRVRDTDRPHLREMVWDVTSHRMSAAFELRGEKLLFCVANDAGVVVTECKPKAGVYYHEFERVKGEK
jgi:hypothetical protein